MKGEFATAFKYIWSWSLTPMSVISVIRNRCCNIHTIGNHCAIYTRELLKLIILFLHFSYATEKSLAGFNVQPRIGINQSLIWLHYNATLLMTSHGYIQHAAPFCKVSRGFWLFLCLNCGVYDTITSNAVCRRFSNYSNISKINVKFEHQFTPPFQKHLHKLP